jgi:hypothetical protein
MTVMVLDPDLLLSHLWKMCKRSGVQNSIQVGSYMLSVLIQKPCGYVLTQNLVTSGMYFTYLNIFFSFKQSKFHEKYRYQNNQLCVLPNFSCNYHKKTNDFFIKNKVN